MDEMGFVLACCSPRLRKSVLQSSIDKVFVWVHRPVDAERQSDRNIPDVSQMLGRSDGPVSLAEKPSKGYPLVSDNNFHRSCGV